MTLDQSLLFAVLAVLFALLIWGRWRYDLVAFGALMVAVVLGLVPVDTSFSGFGHPATIIIAFVLIVSRGLSSSGVVEYIASKVIDGARSLSLHISLMSAVGAVLSSMMNNVAALALLMPIDIQAAGKGNRSPALTLMPLSFATILGGMITLIGTPPNIIVAAFRGQATGQPFSMFDFAPVGAVCAIAGVAFVALIGWRLIPKSRAEHDTGKELFELEGYVAELKVGEESPLIGKSVAEWESELSGDDVQILGLIRRRQRLPGRARRVKIVEGDVLLVEAHPEALEKAASAAGCVTVERDEDRKIFEANELNIREVVVPPLSRWAGRESQRVERTLHRHGISLLGISRRGRRSHQSLKGRAVHGGDILLLVGSADSLDEVISRFELLPLAERGLQVVQREKAGLATGIFALAVGLAAFAVLPLTIALGIAVAAYAAFGIVSLRELYESVEWSVIVLLGCLIPIAQALESTGATRLVVEFLLSSLAGARPELLLTLILVVTMTVSDVLDNTATAVIAAPLSMDLANGLEVNPDAFLMAVAVGASCAFLTPIGHKNNTLILGPGGYRFGDYWRMGLPLEILIVVVSVPAILVFWPL